MERAIKRVEAIKTGNPLDSATMMGAQVSSGQLETILNYIDIGKREGAEVLTGGRRKHMEGDLAAGYYLEPTMLFGNNSMRVFQEEIFGPVLAVTTFKDMDEALVLANDSDYGLGPGCGAVTSISPTGWGAGFKRDGSGPTAIIPIRPTPPSVAISNRVSAGKRTK